MNGAVKSIVCGFWVVALLIISLFGMGSLYFSFPAGIACKNSSRATVFAAAPSSCSSVVPVNLLPLISIAPPPYSKTASWNAQSVQLNPSSRWVVFDTSNFLNIGRFSRGLNIGIEPNSERPPRLLGPLPCAPPPSKVECCCGHLIVGGCSFGRCNCPASNKPEQQTPSIKAITAMSNFDMMPPRSRLIAVHVVPGIARSKITFRVLRAFWDKVIAEFSPMMILENAVVINPAVNYQVRTYPNHMVLLH